MQIMPQYKMILTGNYENNEVLQYGYLKTLKRKLLSSTYCL